MSVLFPGLLYLLVTKLWASDYLIIVPPQKTELIQISLQVRRLRPIKFKDLFHDCIAPDPWSQVVILDHLDHTWILDPGWQRSLPEKRGAVKTYKQQQYNKYFCGFSLGFSSPRRKGKEDSTEPGDSKMVTLLNKEWSTECSLIAGVEKWLHDCLVNTLWLMPWGLPRYPVELGPCS